MPRRDRIQTVRQNQILEYIMMGEPQENAGLHLSLQVDFVQLNILIRGCCFQQSGTHLPDAVLLVRTNEPTTWSGDGWTDDGKGRILVKVGGGYTMGVALEYKKKIYPLFEILENNFRPWENAELCFHFLPAGMANSNGEIIYGEDI